MRVLVTGGAGFIGANLCRRLLSTDGVTSIRVLDDLSSGDRSTLDALSVRLFVGSILDARLLEEAVAGCDTIVHLAAVPSVPRSVKDPRRAHEVNATGTMMVLEAARRAGNLHVILSSSSSVYGSTPGLPKSESLCCMPMSPYAASKLAAESYANAYASCYELPVLPFRFFNVFGPLQRPGHAYAAVVPSFIDAALAGRPLTIYGDGLQSRDFTFVDTVTSVLVDAVMRRITSGPVNLALGTSTTLLDLADALERVLGCALQRDHKPPRPADVKHSQGDNSLLRALFPEVAYRSLESSLDQTVQWFRNTRSTSIAKQSFNQ